MGAETEIAWTDHTFNPWWGCQRVSPGCEHCYAETQDRRWAKTGTVIRAGGSIVEDEKIVHWGPNAPRRFFGDAHWNEPRKWNRDAKEAGVRRRVFCASMADVFEDRPDLRLERDRLWTLIGETPHLDWQLLTKRPENLAKMLPWMPCETDVCQASKVDGVICSEEECDNDNGVRGKPWPNVWIGTTVEDQKRADERIPHLLRVPAAVRFLSCEPLLEEADLSKYIDCPECGGTGIVTETHDVGVEERLGCPACMGEKPLHWVIVGGESGNEARPMRLKWARDLIEQCRAAGVPVFFKQAGVLPMMSEKTWRSNFTTRLLNASASARERVPEGFVALKVSGKGGALDELPGGLNAWPREFPVVAR